MIKEVIGAGSEVLGNDGIFIAESYNGDIVFGRQYEWNPDTDNYDIDAGDRMLTLNEIGHMMKDLDGQNHKVVWEVFVKNLSGAKIIFDNAVSMMDDDIREEIHRQLAPCSEQEFFTAYEIAHQKKFDEEWELSKENPCW